MDRNEKGSGSLLKNCTRSVRDSVSTAMLEYHVPFSVHAINGKWKIGKHIGSGATGSVFEVRDEDTHQKAAAKVGKTEYNSLEDEFKVYDRIRIRRASMSTVGIPKVIHFGTFGKRHALVMPLLGRSLMNVMKKERNFSFKSTVMVGLQGLDRLQLIHSVGIAHHDLKPENLLMGPGSSSIIYLIDFGLVYSFIEKETGSHIKESTKYSGVMGTSLFMSKWAHKGCLHSRRDDMMSLGYLMVYLFKGNLPWGRISELKKREHMKKTITYQNLTAGMPTQFLEYFEKVSRLSFEEEPDYVALKVLLNRALRSAGHSADMKFEWVKGVLRDEDRMQK